MLLKSCCCCGLRNGALAVSIVFLTLSVLELLGVLIGWGLADAVGASEYRYMRNHDPQAFYEYHDPFPEVLAPFTAFVLVQLIFDVLLVHGIRISSTQAGAARRCVIAWLIFRAVLLAIISLGSLGLLITAIVMRYMSGTEVLSVMFGAYFVMTAIISGFFWYSWVAVLSFYWQLRFVGTEGVTYNRIQLETTPPEPRQAAAQPATFGGAAAAEAAGTGQGGGQKWA